MRADCGSPAQAGKVAAAYDELDAGIKISVLAQQQPAYTMYGQIALPQAWVLCANAYQ